MKTWYTVKDGKVNDITETDDNVKKGPEWHEAPNNWRGNHGDKLEWFDNNGIRIQDEELVEQGQRIDKRGKWYRKDDPSAQPKPVYLRDEDPGEEWTNIPPLEKEPYQKWDEQKKTWVVEAEKKAASEKEEKISKKQSAIDDAEKRIQRSTRAKLAGTATPEDEAFFTQINSEIETLREEKRQLLSA